MKRTGKYVSIFMWVLIVITAILAISFLTNISDSGADADMNRWLNASLIWSYILLILGIVLISVFAVVQMVTNFASAKNTLIALFLLGLVILIAYVIATDKMPTFQGAQKFIDNGSITPSIMKWIDTGLITTYILLGVSVISVVYAWLSRLFK